MSKLGEAGGQRGGGSPPLKVQHPKVLKRPEAGDCFETFDISTSFTSSSSSWHRMVSSSTQDLSNWFSSTSAHLKQAAVTAIALLPADCHVWQAIVERLPPSSSDLANRAELEELVDECNWNQLTCQQPQRRGAAVQTAAANR